MLVVQYLDKRNKLCRPHTHLYRSRTWRPDLRRPRLRDSARTKVCMGAGRTWQSRSLRCGTINLDVLPTGQLITCCVAATSRHPSDDDVRPPTTAQTRTRSCRPTSVCHDQTSHSISHRSTVLHSAAAAVGLRLRCRPLTHRPATIPTGRRTTWATSSCQHDQHSMPASESSTTSS